MQEKKTAAAIRSISMPTPRISFSGTMILKTIRSVIYVLTQPPVFFSGFKELAFGRKIFSYLERYANFDFKIDYEQWLISFSRGEEENIKISRGEEISLSGVFSLHLYSCY